MANSISLEQARHRIALTSPDSSGSIKKSKEDDDNHIMGSAIRPRGSLHWNHALDANKCLNPVVPLVENFMLQFILIIVKDRQPCKWSLFSLCLDLGARLLATG